MRRAGWPAAILSVALFASTGSSQDGPAAEGLRAKDVNARRAAANRVRLADREARREALPALIDLLMREKDGQVRLAVLDAVTSLGPEAGAAVPALVHTLRTDYGGQGQEESHQDYRSALALAAIGGPAVEGLRGLLGERKEGVRSEAAMGLGRIGPDAGAAVPDLVPLLKDGSARVRREASRALGLIGPPAVGPLVSAAADGDADARSAAVEALGFLPAPDGRAIRALVEAAHDAAPGVRAAAIRSLAGLVLPEDVLLPIVRAGLRHDDDRVRLAAVGLLVEGRALLPRVAADLESLLADGRDGVARHAAFLLGKSGPDAVPRLIDALRREGSRVDPIAGALAQVGRPAVDRIARAIADPNPRVRRGAALALGQVRPAAPAAPAATRLLAAGLADPDPEARLAFLTALGDLGPRAAESAPAVRALLRDGSPELRARALDVLFRSAPRDGRMLDDVSALLDDPDPRVQRRAVDTVRALGPQGRKALAAVIGLMGSGDPDVRLAAALLAESHGPGAAEAIPALTGLLADPTPEVRTIAAAALGRLGEPSRPALPALAGLLGDGDAAVREAAATALGGLGLDAEAARPHLARALRDEKAEVRRAAGRAIPRLGPGGVILVPDIILMAARKEDLRSVDRLLRPFERGGPDVRSIPELAGQLGHDQVAVRLLAIKFLGLAGPPARGALPALERSCEDPDPEVRRRAKAACEQIDQDPGPGRPKDRAPVPATTRRER